MKRTTTLTLTAATILLSIAWGCSDKPPASSSDQEVQVKGKITYKGKPLPKAKVQFDPSNINRPNAPVFNLEVQDDGTYGGKSLAGENAITVLPPPKWKGKGQFPMNRKDAVLVDGDNTVDIDITDDGGPQ